MTPPNTTPAVSAEFARLRTDRAEAVKEAWRAGRTPDAASVLQANPDLAADRAVALDLAYEEFCVRDEAGESINSSAFCARFPFAASLRRLIAVHRFLDDHPDVLGGAPATWPDPGEVVGDFLLVRELGRGGFSRVYLAAETTAGDRPVVLKVSAPGSREADTLGPLSHPHLVPVLSSRRAGPWSVVAMPFAGTATLEDQISAAWAADRSPPRSAAVILEAAKRGGRPDDPPFPTRPAFPLDPGMTYEDGVAAVAAGLLAAVAYLHENGVAHRDLKPSNVLLGPTGHLYLLDFNLATGGRDPRRLAGTLPYMALEQLALVTDPDAAPPADWRPADVFAVGVILFELLTGRHPFADPAARRENPGQTELAAALSAAQTAGHPDLSVLNPRVRRSVRLLVERCLAVDPAARPTAAELARLFAAPRSGPSRWPGYALALAGLAAVASPALVNWLSAEPEPAPAPVAAAVTTHDREPTVPAPAVAPASPHGDAMILFQQKRFPLAAGEFLKIGQANRDGRAFAYAAYCYTLSASHSDAVAASDTAIEFGYETAPVLANRAYNHYLSGRLDKAKTDCDRALTLDPTVRPARLTRAFIYLQLYFQGRPLSPEALTDIRQVTAGAPNTADVWMLAAQIYALSDDPWVQDEAARAAHNAVLAGKNPVSARMNRILSTRLAHHPVFLSIPGLVPGPLDQSINPQLCCLIP